MGFLAHSPSTVARHSCVRSAVESRSEKEKMYRQRKRMMRQAFGLGLLVALVVLALSACGGGGSAQDQAKAQEEEAKSRPLPQDPGALRPGEYHSVDFEPALSFTLDKGWLNTESQLPDFIEVGQPGETGWISFANVKEVFKPGTLKVVKAPEDIVGWLQQHPHLQTGEPESVNVGGVKGVQLEVVVDHLPKDFHGACGVGCVDFASLSNGEQTTYFKEADRERRVIVLEDVKGETVVIVFSSPPDEFDAFAPKAKKVLDTVKWGGS
jgi:hypothetical protein